MDPLDWSKQYIVFSVSRLDLENDLRFPHVHVASLTDADMRKITERIWEYYQYLEDDFSQTVRFIVRLILIEKRLE